MHIFCGLTDINQPANWPSGIPFPQQRLLVAVDWDSKHYERSRASMNYGPVIYADETSMPGQGRAIDVYNRSQGIPSHRDQYGLTKYYYRVAQGAVYERLNWVPTPLEYTPDPNNDIRITFDRSPEKAAFEDNLSSDRTLMDTIETVPAATVAQLYVYQQQQIRMIRRLVNLISRMLRPDQ